MIDHISPTSLGMWLRCPQQYMRRYLLNQIIPPGIAMVRGGAVHQVLAENHRQKKQSGRDLSEKDMIELYHDGFFTQIREMGIYIPKSLWGEKEELLKAAYNDGRQITKIYCQEVAPKISPVEVEKELSIDFGLPFKLMGVVDLLTEEEVVEFKTLLRLKSQTEVDASLQLGFYYGLVNALEPHHGKKMVMAMVTPKGSQIASQKASEAVWRQVLLRIQFFWKQFQSGVFPPTDPMNWWCDPKFCGYAPTCKYCLRTGGVK